MKGTEIKIQNNVERYHNLEFNGNSLMTPGRRFSPLDAMISETSESSMDRELTFVCRSIGVIVMKSNCPINSTIYW